MTERKQIIMLLGPYVALFPSCKLDAAGLGLYARALQELPAAAIEAAMNKLVKTCRFFPTVAEITQEAEALMEYASERNGGVHTPTAAEAWSEVQTLAKRIGTWSEWHCSHPYVRAAAERFGIYELSTLPADGVNTARAQFMRMYESVREQGRQSRLNANTLKSLGQAKVLELCQGMGNMRALPE